MSMIKTSAILVAVALAVMPPMAQAASSTCNAGWGDGFCHTDNIPANPQFHFVHVDVNGPCSLFTVRDRANGITVFQGSSGWSGYERTIGGLYSEYSVYLYGGAWPVTYVTISN
jgi:hypothetical protein